MAHIPEWCRFSACFFHGAWGVFVANELQCARIFTQSRHDRGTWAWRTRTDGFGKLNRVPGSDEPRRWIVQSQFVETVQTTERAAELASVTR
jgi:hypothetical protein